MPRRPLSLLLPVAVALALTLAACAESFLARVAREPGAVRRPSGVVVRTLRAGDGPKPGPGDAVRVRYQATRADGAAIASGASTAAKASAEPALFPVRTLIPCWREVVPTMRLGEHARLWCPSEVAYGDPENPPGMPGKVELAFDVELLGIEPAAPETELVLDSRRAPSPDPARSSGSGSGSGSSSSSSSAAAKARAAAGSSASGHAGFALRVITPGDGERPAPNDKVKVHYEGKLTDGHVFDSSIARGEAAVFPLDAVIPCWTRAIPQMHVGEKAEITCPADLAYGERGNPPSIPPNATLIFEVELLGIER